MLSSAAGDTEAGAGTTGVDVEVGVVATGTGGTTTEVGVVEDSAWTTRGGVLVGDSGAVVDAVSVDVIADWNG